MSSSSVLCVFVAIFAYAFADVKNGPLGATSSPDNMSGPVRETPAGRVLGSWMETRAGRRFEAYRGVRYAEPPVGHLRFQPPLAITRYSSTVDAREDGPACPQPAQYPVHEDCLRLNVYTPENTTSSSLLPVLVYIHPGGFYSVTGRSDVAGPQYLLEKDVVLVTINYRLGSLGFLSTGDEWAPGNNGLKDQVAALRWVQCNIRAFGGNPDLVTAAGYSAGSLSIGLHMVSPMAKGLFHRAIMMSATPLSQVVMGPHQRHLAERAARVLGCSTDDSRQMVECLRTKKWEDFATSLDNMFEFGWDPILLWNAVVEPDYGQERYLTEPPLASYQAGRHHAVPALIGQTSGEFFWKAFNVLKNATLFANMSENWSDVAPISFLLPARGPAGEPAAVAARELKKTYFSDNLFRNDSATAAALGKLYSDAVIGFAVHRMSRVLARHSQQPVHQYMFGYKGQRSHYVDPVTKKPVAAAHHDELLYLFSVPVAYPDVALDSKENEVVNALCNIWVNFAKTGDPSPSHNVSWPAFTPENRQYLFIDSNHNQTPSEHPLLSFTVHENLYEERFQVWNQLDPNPCGDTPELGALSWPPLTTQRPQRYLKVDRELSVHEYPRHRYNLWEELYPMTP